MFLHETLTAAERQSLLRRESSRPLQNIAPLKIVDHGLAHERRSVPNRKAPNIGRRSDSQSISYSRNLCEQCRSLRLGDRFAGVERGELDISNHPGFQSLATLRQSALTCACCDFLHEAFRSKLHIRDPTEESRARVIRAFQEWTDDIKFYLGNDVVDSISITLNVVFLQEEAASDEVDVQGSSDSSASSTSELREGNANKTMVNRVHFATLTEMAHFVSRRWIHYCNRNHICRRDAPHQVPRRLLWVGSQDRPELRLVDTQLIEVFAEYIALSHRWGASQPYVLTSSNLDEFQSIMNEESMPRTFQDAIQFIRLLKIQYLWIDSLCIVQDDRSDWQAHSAVMGGIYRDAYLTLSVSSSPSDSHGFLNPRRPAAAFCGSVELDSGAYRDVYITDSRLMGNDGLVQGPLRDEPLTSRAWTVQERYLSRRTLHFGSKQMFWECQDYREAEDGRNYGADSFRLDTPSDDDWGPDDYTRWAQLVERYTLCDLTYTADKLSAISGIAHEYAAITEDIYIAGHWLQDLPSSLMWSARYSDSSIFRASTYRAPSWSWASVDGAVAFGVKGLESRCIAIVAEHEVKAAGMDEFGEVSDATLTLVAPVIGLASVALTPSRDHVIVTFRNGVVGRCRTCLDVKVDDDHNIAAVFVGVHEWTPEFEDQEKTLYCGLLVEGHGDDWTTVRRIGVIEDCVISPEDFESIRDYEITLK